MTAMSPRGLKSLPAASLISFSAGAPAIGDDCCPQIASLRYRFGSIKFEPGSAPISCNSLARRSPQQVS